MRGSFSLLNRKKESGNDDLFNNSLKIKMQANNRKWLGWIGSKAILLKTKQKVV
jgi:hypothetical protein